MHIPVPIHMRYLQCSHHHTTILTYSQMLHNTEKICYRKQLHLPSMLKCMTQVFGEFIKSSCEQTVLFEQG